MLTKETIAAMLLEAGHAQTGLEHTLCEYVLAMAVEVERLKAVIRAERGKKFLESQGVYQ